MAAVAFLSPAGPMSGPAPHICGKLILVPEVLISIFCLISLIESLIVFNCALQLKLIIYRNLNSVPVLLIFGLYLVPSSFPVPKFCFI